MDRTATDEDAWQDITCQFKESIQDLRLGELLKFDNFTLLDAMGAIELLDPKMDSGVMLQQTKRKILTLEQSIRLGTVKVKDLRYEELIGIIDDTYVGLATWLDGNSFAQTFMTNLYLHDIELLEDPCLKSFSLASLKLAYFIDRVISLAFCIEEEDFNLTGKFNLANSVSDQKALNSIEETCLHYEKKLSDILSMPAQISTNNNCKKTDQQQQIGDEKQSPSERDLLTALIDRLRFTSSLYTCLMNICRILFKKTWFSESLTDIQLAKTVKLFQQTVQNSDSHLKQCLEYLDKWEKSIDLGIKPSKSSNAVENDYPTIMGFDPLINLRNLPPTYPRCLNMVTRPQSIEYLRNLILKLRKCIELSSSFNLKSFHNSLDLIENFSKYYSPKSCVLSRSFLLALYLPNHSIKLLRNATYQSLLEFCEPLILAMRKDEAKSSVLDEFISECEKPFYSALTKYGHNSARQYERFPELITAFKGLQYSALLINSAFNNSIIYSWTTCNLARLCIKYVLSGFELELFSAHEYPYVFWYLYDILYRNEREQLELAKQCIIESQINLAEDQASNKKTKNKKQRKKNLASTNHHDRCILCNDAFRFLSGGLFLMTYGLRLQGKIRSPPTDYTNEQVCFDHRFGLLTGTSVYPSYKQTLTRLTKLEMIFREAQECFSEAKILFDTLEEHENCLKVCKTNMVVARILASNPDSFKERELEFNFDTHPCFPTVKI